MYLMLMSIKLQPSFNRLVQRVLLLHQQFSKIFVGHFVFGFFTVPLLLLLFATLPLPGHHPREQGDMCLTLAGTAERDGGEGEKGRREGRTEERVCEWREDTDTQ